MPLPTTRYGRFVFRQRRYQRRRRKQNQNGYTRAYNPLTKNWDRTGRVGPTNNGPLQAGPKVGPAGKFFLPVNIFLFPTTPRRIIKGTWGRFPVARLGDNPGGLDAVISYHAAVAMHGYHVRPVRGCRRKPNQMSALARRVWGCNGFYIQNGYFPNDDVLGRRPNEDDYWNGAAVFPEGPIPSIRPTSF